MVNEFSDIRVVGVIRRLDIVDLIDRTVVGENDEKLCPLYIEDCSLEGPSKRSVVN